MFSTQGDHFDNTTQTFEAKNSKLKTDHFWNASHFSFVILVLVFDIEIS